MIDFYCIHHTPSIDRKEYLIPFFKSEVLDVKWMEGFLPDCDYIKNIKKIYSQHSANKIYLNDAELSCYCKHLQALKFISESTNHGLIIEDDIEIPNFKFKSYLDSIITEFLNQNGDLLFLGSFTGSDISDNYPYEIACEKWMKSRCAHCYLITNQCAKKIIHFMNEIKAPLDWQLNYAIDKFELKCFWTKKHINQRTEKGKLKSLLR